VRGVEREYVATFIVAVVALLVIVGGYASFSGLAVYDEPIKIELAKTTFSQGDVFDADVVVNPVTFLADESIMVYIDNKVLGAIAIKKYLDDNGIEYGTEIKSLGQETTEIINLKDPLTVNLADFVSLEYMQPGTAHVLRVEFSRGDALAEALFRIE
jgi:hypothetical protein